MLLSLLIVLTRLSDRHLGDVKLNGDDGVAKLFLHQLPTSP